MTLPEIDLPDTRKVISVTTPCYNEEENVEELYRRVRAMMEQVGRFRYEHIFIDNCSTDRTVEILKRLAAADPNVKIIVNARNFGQIRSPMHAFFQARGDAVLGMVADLQDPPELIPEMIAKWEQGYAMVLCIKRSTQDNPMMSWIRGRYYQTVQALSSIETFENYCGFGLFDRRVVEAARAFDDPYPYFRGMIAEIGLPFCEIPYDQPARTRGFTKNNFFTLYELGMLGITKLSKVPLRIVTFMGFAGSILSVLVGLAYLVYKLLFWSQFSLGIAPLVIGLSLISSVQLLALGIIGEYVGSIHTHVHKRPYVVELERVNFEIPAAMPLKEAGTLREVPSRVS